MSWFYTESLLIGGFSASSTGMNLTDPCAKPDYEIVSDAWFDYLCTLEDRGADGTALSFEQFRQSFNIPATESFVVDPDDQFPY